MFFESAVIGEKHLPLEHYFTGADHGDDWSMYCGYQDDTSRSGFWPPASDAENFPGKGANCRFGSPHRGTWSMAFCDGSVRALRLQIDSQVHRRLANRSDGLPIDDSELER